MTSAATDTSSFMPPYLPQTVVGGVHTKQGLEAVRDGRALYAALDFRPMSPNFIEPARATAWRTEVGLVSLAVGIFFNEDPQKIIQLHKNMCISVAMLNGGEDDAYIAALKQEDPLLTVWKTFIVSGPDDLLRAADSTADLVVLASPDPAKPFDWGLINPGFRSYVLYGGVTRMNVRNICAHLEPFGVMVDYDTDVLQPDGTRAKSAALIQEFMQNSYAGAAAAQSNAGHPFFQR